MIDMEMRDEHLVELIQREATSDVIGDRTFTEIEDEVLAVSELHEHGCVHLAWPDEGRSSHEDDPHLVRTQLLSSREPVGCRLQSWGGIDAFEQQPLFPAPHRNATGQCPLDVLPRRLRFLGGFV